MDRKQSENMVEILSSLLTGQSSYDEALQQLKHVNLHPSFLSPAFRLLGTMQAGEMHDFLGHLRQCLLYCGRELPVSVALQGVIERDGDSFGLFINNHHVDARPRMMVGIKGLESNYQMVMKRNSRQVVSDGRMYRCYHYGTYTSLAQKAINYYIANMEAGETFLACLPTGGGKSLSWQLPAMTEMWPGTIIVVVPTVALALDHARSSKGMMQMSFGINREVMAYTPSDMEDYDRRKALKALETGNLSILYISPEALMQDRFKMSLLDAAEEGHVSALVIDETHLVVSWGRQFRPEFQLLPALRNQLEKLCPWGLRTILLTATLTASDAEVLRKLFASDHFTELRADSLREEPSYYTHKCEDESERKKHIRHLLGQVPRPVIIYVDTIEQCDDYLKSVKSWGYTRVASFSGKTATKARKLLIEQWNHDDIDIMIATSAFGMGVDKSDVRTIITAYIPESISRFYQEVGRAGRDGYASLSYWLYVKRRDRTAIRDRMKRQVIGAKNLVARWKSLRKGEKVIGHPDWLIVDKEKKPKHLEGNMTGKKNAGWNKDVIMMLYRADLIDIIDCEIVHGNEDIFRITIQMKDIDCLQDDCKLAERIEPFRDKERESIDEAMAAVDRLLESDVCFADFLEEAFYDAEVGHMIPLTCHGCPSCRASGESSFEAGEASIDMHSNRCRDSVYLGSRIPFDAAMREMLLGRSEIALLRRGDDDFASMVTYMVRNQVNVIVADDFSAEGLLPALSRYEQYDYVMLTLPEAISLMDCDILDGTCALFYTRHDDEIQSYQQFGKEFMANREKNRVIHIFYEDYIAHDEGRLMTDMLPTTWIGGMMEDSCI